MIEEIREELTRKLLDRLSIGGLNECWEWQGPRHLGYGRLSLFGPKTQKIRYASTHRVAYQLWRGPIAEGMSIDHLCRNRACANPRHLEVVTPRENFRRSPLMNEAKTHCKHGHEFTPENTYTRPYGGRACRTCQTKRSREYQRRKRHQALEARYVTERTPA